MNEYDIYMGSLTQTDYNVKNNNNEMGWNLTMDYDTKSIFIYYLDGKKVWYGKVMPNGRTIRKKHFK